MTVSACAPKTLDPWLLLCSEGRSPEMHTVVMASRAVAINNLSEHAEGTARFVADNPSEPSIMASSR